MKNSTIQTIPFLILAVLFLFVSNWHVFISTLSGFGKPTSSYTSIENRDLTNFIEQKTGVEIGTFYLVNSESLFASMTGIPTQPIMTISQKLYDTFTQEELEYIVLHETGHYVLGHSIKEALLQLGVVVIAYFLFRSLQFKKEFKVLIAIGLSVVTGVFMIQVARQFEWQADTYALQHLDDPRSMILATQKLESAWGGPPDDALLRKLFYRGIPYSQRIKYAESHEKFN